MRSRPVPQRRRERVACAFSPRAATTARARRLCVLTARRNDDESASSVRSRPVPQRR
jgi:hypothetical protein